MLRSSKGLLVANSPAEQALRLMVGKAWRLARTRRRRAAWAAEAVSVVRLAAVIAPVTGGANWLTSTMMVLRQALAPYCFQEPLHLGPCHFRTAWIHAGPSRRVHAEGRCACTRVGGGPRVQEAEDRQGSRFGRCFIGMRARTGCPPNTGLA